MPKIYQTLKITIILFATSLQIICQSSNNIKRTLKTADSLFLLQKWQKAKQVYESNLNDTVFNCLAWNRLGYSNYNLKLNAQAIKCYKKAIEQKPASTLKPIIYSRLARVLAITNDVSLSLDAIDSAIVSGYTNIKELDTLQEFKKLRTTARFIKLREVAYVNANPCMSNNHAREFDFWVGEWNVFVAGTTQYAGHSFIQIISGGCAILENWESPNSNGTSINFIDPVTNKWKQSWAGNYIGGIQEFVNGEYKDNAMRFEFETKDANGNKILGRFIFYNQGTNQVRQFNETSNDEGKTWTTNYDFSYIRKK